MLVKFSSWMMIFCALLLSKEVQALNQVRLLKTSPAREILVLNIGKSYFDGDKSTLAALIDEEIIVGKAFEEKKVFVLRALLKSVKIKNNVSAWRIVRLPGEFSYEEDKKYYLLSLENSLRGRKMYDLSNRKIITDNLLQSIKDYETMDDSNRLAHKNDDYILSDHVKSSRSNNETDFELPELATWEGEEVLKAKELYNSPHRADFTKAKRLATFEKMVGLFLDIYNDPNFNYASYYFEQRRTPYNKEVQEKSSQVSATDSYWYKKRKAAVNRSRYLREIQSKGEAWSEDFNEHELEEAVINIGLDSERKRQTDFVLRRFDYQINFNAGYNLKDNAANTGRETTLKFHVGTGIEVFPFKRFVNLSKFTLSAGIRLANDSVVESGIIPADLKEYSLSSYVNYYFLNPVQSIKRLVPFVSLGLRFGRADVSTFDGLKGFYNLSTIPALNFGCLYNSKDDQGYRVNLSMETINLNLVNGDSGIADQIIYHDARIGFAWTKLL